MKLGSLASLAVVGVVALTACSGDGGEGTKSEAAGGASDAAVTPPRTPEIPRLAKKRGIIADTAVEECSTTPGAVEAHGEVTNTDDRTRDLVVVVSWTTATADVVGRGVAMLERVAPGQTKTWRVEAEAGSAGDDTLICVPTALAGRLT